MTKAQGCKKIHCLVVVFFFFVIVTGAEGRRKG